jgi:hypothetical protein
LPPKKKKEVDVEDPFGPLSWVNMPPAFFEKVRKAALEMGMSQKDLVSEAVKDFVREGKKETRRAILPTTPQQEELVRKFQQRAGALRWAGVKKADRIALLRKASQARWGTKKRSDN